MRIIVFFDLPVETSSDRRAYRSFRRFLIKSGFTMMQESVYCKIAPNATAADTIISNIRRNKPDKGIVQAIRITEKQFSRMDYIVGEKRKDTLDNDDKLVII